MQGGGHMKREAGMGVTQLLATEHPSLPAAMRGDAGTDPPRASEGARPAHTFISDIQPPGRATVLSFKPPSLWYLSPQSWEMNTLLPYRASQAGDPPAASLPSPWITHSGGSRGRSRRAHKSSRQQPPGELGSRASRPLEDCHLMDAPSGSCPARSPLCGWDSFLRQQS